MTSIWQAKKKNSLAFSDLHFPMEAQVIMRLKLSPNDKHKTSDYCRSTNDFIVAIVY